MWKIGERKNTSIWVSVGKFGGKIKINLRHYFLTNSEEWQATKRGIALDVNEWYSFLYLIDKVDLQVRELQNLHYDEQQDKTLPIPGAGTDENLQSSPNKAYTPSYP